MLSKTLVVERTGLLCEEVDIVKETRVKLDNVHVIHYPGIGITVAAIKGCVIPLQSLGPEVMGTSYITPSLLLKTKLVELAKVKVS